RDGIATPGVRRALERDNPCEAKPGCYNWRDHAAFLSTGRRALWRNKSERPRKSAKELGARGRDTMITTAMSDSFAEFLTRLQARDSAAAEELFQRFAHQLIALARRRIADGLRHKVDPEEIVQSAYKSFFGRYGEGPLDVVNWNSLWGLLTLITVRKCAERVAYYR